jgi:hypothetical protein
MAEIDIRYEGRERFHEETLTYLRGGHVLAQYPIPQRRQTTALHRLELQVQEAQARGQQAPIQPGVRVQRD